MSMAIKYGMNKRRKMAEGGKVKGVHKPAYEGEKGKELGHSETGIEVRGMRYSNRSPHDPEARRKNAHEGHHKVLSEMRSMKKPNLYAEGGEVCSACNDGLCAEHGGAVDRIMAKRMSEGGMVANDTPATADAEPADFDVLATDDDLEFHDTGANSGDEDGDYASDDPVDRIMMKRKKDRNPRPA